MLPSPYGWGFDLRGFSLSGPPMRSLSLQPSDSLTSPKDCFVEGPQIFGFPEYVNENETRVLIN